MRSWKKVREGGNSIPFKNEKKNMFKSLDQDEESFAGCWLTMNQF